jgi:hypothetical protein
LEFSQAIAALLKIWFNQQLHKKHLRIFFSLFQMTFASLLCCRITDLEPFNPLLKDVCNKIEQNTCREKLTIPSAFSPFFYSKLHGLCLAYHC